MQDHCSIGICISAPLTTMHRTIFSTPVVNTALRGLSLAYLRLKGWTGECSLPANAEKCVPKTWRPRDPLHNSLRPVISRARAVCGDVQKDLETVKAF